MQYLRYCLSTPNSNRIAKYHLTVSCPHHNAYFVLRIYSAQNKSGYMQFYCILHFMCVWSRNKEMSTVRDKHRYEHMTTDTILLPLLLAAQHGDNRRSWLHCTVATDAPGCTARSVFWLGSDAACGSRREFPSARTLYQKRLLSVLFDDAVSCQDCMASV